MLKSVFSKFLGNLNKETEIDESRRRVVKGIGGLMALAAVSPVLNLSEITNLGVSDFHKMVENGVIENVTFYLDRTIVLEDIENLTIRNCEFISLDGFIGHSMIDVKESVKNTYMTYCRFNCDNVQKNIECTRLYT